MFVLVFLLIHSFVHSQTPVYKTIFYTKDEKLTDILNENKNIKGDSLEIINQLRLLIHDFHNKAYLAASIDSIRFDSINAYVYLYRGCQYSWSKLDFSDLEPKLLGKLNLHKNDFDIVDLTELQKLKSSVISFYENSGYPFVSVNFNPFEINDSIFNAKLNVVKGDYYIIDSIIIKGDAKISSNYIKKIIQVNPSTSFNQQSISKISKNIDNINFLSEIKPAEIEFKQDAVDLYLYLKNKKANSFNGIIGFLSDNKKTGKLLITGELNLNLVNSFARGEEILLNWEKIESSTQKLNLGFNYPYIFKSNFGIDTDFGLYKKDSTYLSLNTNIGLRLFLNTDNYVKGYYRYKSSSRIGNDLTNSTLINYADIKSNVFGALYYLNSLDYKQNPRKGVELNLFGGIGSKQIIDAKNTIDSLNVNIDNKTIEIELGIDLNIFLPIYNNFVFHFGNTTRYMDQFADKGQEALFFENELYRFGGAKSLRGFDESIFYASAYSLQNIEIKYLLEKNSAFYVFWNGAYYYKNVSQTVTEDFPWGFGVGLNFDTKAGIFSISYALGKQFDNPLEIKSAKIHFGYISRF